MLTAFLTHNPEDLDAYYPRALPELQSIAWVVLNPFDRDLDPNELVAAAVECAVIIAHRATPGGAGPFVDLPRLLAVLRCAVDVSTIDVPAASAAGVLIARADKSFVAATAELALALMLDLAGNVTESTMDYRHAGSSPQRPGRQLRGRTAGIIGYGSIGSIGSYLARLLHEMGMRVIVCDRDVAVTSGGIEQCDLPTLLRRSDFVLPLAAATASTEKLIDAAALDLVRPGTMLVNVSRGELLDEAAVAVAAALDSGRLGGLAMDVGRARDQRPSPAPARRPGVIATSHLGGLTPQNADAQATSSVEQVRAILAGIMPSRAVNPEHAGQLRAWWRDHHFIEESS